MSTVIMKTRVATLQDLADMVAEAQVAAEGTALDEILLGQDLVVEMLETRLTDGSLVYDVRLVPVPID